MRKKGNAVLMWRLVYALIAAVAAVELFAVETVELPCIPAPGLIDGELTEPSWGKVYAVDSSGDVVIGERGE